MSIDVFTPGFERRELLPSEKHIREDVILPELVSDNLSDVPEDIFQRKLRFCERNKNCAARKNTVKVIQAPRKVTILQVREQPLG
jgi:hypothetical protein